MTPNLPVIIIGAILMLLIVIGLFSIVGKSTRNVGIGKSSIPTATTIREDMEQLMVEVKRLENEGKTKEALEIYSKILEQDPTRC